ncbi:chaperonin GroEL [Amycolatopsis sp. YIM 10]|uniref:chaperonin GroEL n=1 Tax=Amycolatopsis sp. YIM 10 TaxID=2653857 RepID=UPI00128FD073|nr:chaperonin GroEL [Amycolatopsis sp. YIM 10]QFU92611.1 60 kDa chaperonin 2 [Amycolatopsis sp. YIM 10]
MGRYALLVATGQYADPRFSRLRAPDQDVSRLAAVLEDSDVGGFDEVNVLRDATDFEVRLAVEGLLSDRRREDLVLLYFSCHGFRSAQSRLYFATANTRYERPAGSAVSRSFINEQFEDCHAGGRVLFLDCCFSGAFGEGLKSAPSSALAGQVGEGYVVVTASDAFEHSFEGDTLALDASRSSVFTDVLLEALTSGGADLDADGWISLDELFSYVRDGVARRRPDQKPKLFAHAAEPNLIQVARARHARVAPSLEDNTESAISPGPPRIATYTQSHQIVARGIRVIAEVIGRTLGPLGRHVLIRGDNDSYLEARDSASIAASFKADDPRDDLGVGYIRELVHKVHCDVGDGATTATVLTESMTTGALDALRRGASPARLKRSLERALEVLLAELPAISTEVHYKEQISSTIARSAGDAVIGDLLAEALDKVGKEGVVTVEESSALSFALELTEGTRFDRGYLSGSFVTDPDRAEAVLEDPYILLCSSELLVAEEMVPMLEKVMQASKPLLVIADDVDGSALATLVVNKVHDTFKSVAVKAPGFGERRKALLQDIAIVTGGTVLGKDGKSTLAGADVSSLGRARRVVVTSSDTTIIDGAGDYEQIQNRVDQLRREIDSCDSDYDREKLRERLAKLAGGVAIVRVGAQTEKELRERKGRVERAIRVARVLVEEGMVPGGGVTLLELRARLDHPELTEETDRMAAHILRDALAAPFRQIVRNADLDEQDTLDALARQPAGTVFDVAEGAFAPETATNLLDPAAVVRTALTTAVALTGRLLMVS